MGSYKNSLSISDAGVKRIAEHEGTIDGLYNDPSKYCTYGVGHLVRKSECFMLAGANSDEQLKKSIQKQWPGKSYETTYIPRTIVTSENFAKIKEAATKNAQEYFAQRQHKKSFVNLASADQERIKTHAEAAIKEETDLLPFVATDQFKKDLQSYETTVNSGVTGVALTQGMFDALVSFVYNVGKGAFNSSQLLKKINENIFMSGDDMKKREEAIKEIEEEFLKWNKSGGSVLKGLTTRRQDEADRFLSQARQSLETLKMTQNLKK